MFSLLVMKFEGSLRSPLAFMTMTSTPVGNCWVGPSGCGICVPLSVTVGICAFGSGLVPWMGCELVATSIVTSVGRAMRPPWAWGGRLPDPLRWRVGSQWLRTILICVGAIALFPPVGEAAPWQPDL